MNKESIIEYFSNALSHMERMDILRAIGHDDELRKEFITYRNLKGLLMLSETPGDRDEGKASYKEFIREKKRKQTKRILERITKYAAVIVFVIIGTWLAAYHYYNNQSQSQIEYNTITTPPGQHASLTLSDGTEVWINARSAIRYPSRFNDKERKIEMKGEAYFKVARDTERPFIVSAPALDVNVFGTTFNVKCNEENTQTDVSLLSGSVEVFFPENRKRVLLQPMERLNYAGGKIMVTKLQNKNDFLWKQGILFFEQTTLSEIAREIEWHYDARVIIGNPKIGEQIYSGKFRQQDGPYEIFRILQKSNNFKLKKDDANNIIEIK